MTKRFFLLLLLLVVFATIASPATAQAPAVIYVDPSRTSGNEDGSKDNPYNKRTEGVAYLQSLPYGGDLYIKRADGTWEGPIQIDPTLPGTGGAPLPAVTLFMILAVFALMLILIGWFLMRRSRQIQG